MMTKLNKGNYYVYKTYSNTLRNTMSSFLPGYYLKQTWGTCSLACACLTSWLFAQVCKLDFCRQLVLC